MKNEDIQRFKEAVTFEREQHGNTSIAAMLEATVEEIERLEVELAVAKGARDSYKAQLDEFKKNLSTEEVTG